jgi:2-amino-4-hydroxy-6-hydroxymethyldihydropteridine diphosphokinase
LSEASRQAVTVYLGLGANLGDPVAALLKAMDELAALDGVTLMSRSSLYQSAPIESGGPDYVNAVLEIQTTLTAPALLAQLRLLEQAAGRERPYRNAPRVLDLDMLTYGDASMSSAELVIPHARMSERAFVLLPLAEIAPHRVSAALLQSVQDQAIERLIVASM